MSKARIPLSPGFHAEPGETKGHLHDVYTTINVGENERLSVGELTEGAIEAWREAERQRIAALGRLAGARVRL